MSYKLIDEIHKKRLENRIVMLHDGVMPESSKRVIDELLYLNFLDPKAPIHFMINSPGGSVSDGFAIWDVVKSFKNPVNTIVYGLAASMGSVLSLVGGKGRRFAFPHARIMIHQPRIGGTSQGQASDIKITAEEIIKTKKELVKLYVDATGRSVEEIERALDRDYWLTAKEAQEYGLLDRVITSLDEI
ncbi:MAG: ATP-dependent Clp protease proteolytic subunit [Chlamydiia bacterium]